MPESPQSAAQACLPRSRENLQAVIEAEAVETNELYLPGKGLTWCNKYVQALLLALEVPFPKTGWFAHQQIDYLAGVKGKAAGWALCSSEEGRVYANEGKPVVVAYRNPKVPPEGHSHIALLTPTQSRLQVSITQAGRRNYADVELSKGFGKLPVRFYWHL